ncbi:hypothetical protein GGS21DRAFT_489941 [Xylaria nigripes]|nr:hypothetical protein GGS21DRAFT_489941 [Xylaria nigripes]
MFPHLTHPNEPIAIIGSACRFPGGASSPSKFWQLVKEPRDLVRQIHPDRFNAERFYSDNGRRSGTSNVKHAYTLSEDPKLFDAHFFGITPIEATGMDPGHRLLLEVTYEALESSGLPREDIRGSNMGVFVGLMGEDYSSIAGRDIQNIPRYLASGTARSILSNRLSYVFDLHGPSMTIDTACSSSLVALHQAVQSLRTGESTGAIVAGSNLILGPEPFLAESQLKMLSPTGRSRMWDKAADGYARADGIAVLILKRLSDAIANKDYIDCIVRETGINQDGRTQGITTPNPKSQAALIKETYCRAGLDYTKISDQPQYFEAHGTGTATGDPIEAAAIHDVFIDNVPWRSSEDAKTDHTIYVGSLKTVMGHSEGAAGVAGVLKASLALQNSIIPPNLLLNEINPKVAPLLGRMQVAREAVAWPVGAAGARRRASVNSFGFGGTNAHAILESFLMNQPYISTNLQDNVSSIMPFVFSAMSEQSLFVMLYKYALHLQSNPSISLRDLSWTLNTRRSELPVRVAISALTSKDLIAKLEQASKGSEDFKPHNLVEVGMSDTRILGVFTGQGAQWATMGVELLQDCRIVANCFVKLQRALDTLPIDYRPTWSLSDELTKSAEVSRIGEVEFSQPVCTALQIALVDLLESAEVKLTVVVGHSSGEIAAAYAAGYLSAEHAIRIAYLRGYFCGRMSPTAPTGAMMAIGTTPDDARELIELPAFKGRVCIAAINSPISVTLSGDMDALARIQLVMDDEKKFSRLLKVDRAYHSHHMLPCVDPYVKALHDCDIRVRDRDSGRTYPRWVSSVVVADMDHLDLGCLNGQYWGDNMTNTVLFSQAIELSTHVHGPFNIAAECGPHPALKGPVLDIFELACGVISTPYTGTLSRGCDDRIAFANALGFLWKILGKHVVNFDALDKAVHGTQPARLLKDLPTYPWAHHRTYWHETRQTAMSRYGKGLVHQMIGSECPDQSERETRFRNHLNLDELPWLAGHRIQGKVVFPAAGYVSAAITAITSIIPIDEIELLELSKLSFKHALVLDEDSALETQISITILERNATDLQAVFFFYSDSRSNTNLTLQENATGNIRVTFGKSSSDSLPQSPLKSNSVQWLDISPDIFYTTIGKLGYNYTGVFKALSNMKRKLNEASGRIGIPKNASKSDTPLTVHPAILDNAIQGILLASSFPGDGALRQLHLPDRIDQIRLNIQACQKLASGSENNVIFHASSSFSGGEMIGDVEICLAHDDPVLIQLEGLHAIPMLPISTHDENSRFYEYKWAPESLDVVERYGNLLNAPRDEAAFYALERVAFFYIRSIHAYFLENSPTDSKPLKKLPEYIHSFWTMVIARDHPYTKEVWHHDTRDTIAELIQKFQPHAELSHLGAIGASLTSRIKGIGNASDSVIPPDLSDNLYDEVLGFGTSFKQVAKIWKSLNHQFPFMNVLEIGDEIGNASSYLLDEIDQTFGSYTHTEISCELLGKAKERLKNFQDSIDFCLFDPIEPSTSQGSIMGPYDIVIAPMLTGYYTSNIKVMVKTLRNLLKAGGYLIAVAATDNRSLQLGLVRASLSFRQPSSQNDVNMLASPMFVHSLRDMLLQNGFAAIDAEMSLNSPNFSGSVLSVLIVQATDRRVQILRDPFAASTDIRLASLTVIGSNKTIGSFINKVEKQYDVIEHFLLLTDIESADLPVGCTVVSFVDLEKNSVFQDMTAAKLKALKNMLRRCRNVLWVSYGAQSENPFKNMLLGLQRTVALEMTHLRMQSIDFHSFEEINYRIVAKKLLQLEAWCSWEDTNQTKDLLWVLEPEFRVKDGVIHVPRLLLSPDRNQRYMSHEQPLKSQIAAVNNCLAIRQRNSQLYIEAESTTSNMEKGSIRLLYSLLRPIHFGRLGAIFVSIGEKIGSDDKSIVLSEALDSVVSVPPGWTIPLSRTSQPMIQVLSTLYSWSVAHNILLHSIPGKPLVVFGSEPAVEKRLAELAARNNVDLVLLTTTEKICSHPWRFLHPRASKRDIRAAIPVDTGTYVQMRLDDDLSSSVATFIPTYCKKLVSSDFLRDHIRRYEAPCQLSQITDQLGSFYAEFLTSTIRQAPDIETPQLGLNDLVSGKTLSRNKQMIVCWTRDSTVQVSLKPASDLVKFSSSHTYWLVGLTGGLGITLCQWMMAHGAKYIALTSRNPNIDRDIIRSITRRGCFIEIFSGDVSSRSSLINTHKSIVRTMPAIKGVVHGAMVIHDSVFPQLDLEDLEAVTAPKVQGSLYLDEIFSHDSLDFLIFLSSTVYVCGHAGQSAYAMANSFMAALASNRRQRGLAASVLNLGAIRGNGYISREMSVNLQEALIRAGFSFVDEHTFHEMVAEGILSGRPERLDGYEITTGLNLEDGHGVKSWEANPIFSHLVTKSRRKLPILKQQVSAVSMATQLEQATSNEQRLEIAINSFLSKLLSMLQVDGDKALLSLSSDAIGIDSITAVDIQSWFRRELKAEISILEITNARSMRDLLYLVPDLFVSDHVPEGAPGESLPENDESDKSSTSYLSGALENNASSLNMNSHVNRAASNSSIEIDPPAMSTPDESTDPNLSSINTLDFTISSLPRPPLERVAPLSFAQSRFWFLRFFVNDPASFNVTTIINLKGHLDFNRLSTALNAVGQRHEALRTIFFCREKSSDPVQGILRTSILELERDITVADDKIIQDTVREMENSAFDFADGPLLRMKLLSRSEDDHAIVLVYHHIIMDGIGFEIFCSDLDSAYHGKLDTIDNQLLQYPDYTLRQIHDYEGGSWATQLSYWRKHIAELLPPLPLLSLSPRSTRPETSIFDSHTISLRLPKSLEQNIKRCCQAFGVKPFHFYLATFGVLLFRLTSDVASDVFIGVADGNRKEPDTLRSLGLFLNLLPLRVPYPSTQTFGDTLKAIRATSDEAFSNSQVPFDVMLQQLHVPRSPAHSPLFQAFLNYRQNVRESRIFLDCAAEGRSLSVGQNAYDISLDIIDSHTRENQVTVAANKGLYTVENTRIIGQCYINLLQAFCRDPRIRSLDAPLFEDEDIQGAIRVGQGPESPSEWPPTMIERIDKMIQSYGDRVALCDDTKTLTYKEMASRVSRIANKITELGIEMGSCIAILQSSGVDWVCSLLAVMRTGTICVPMDLQVGIQRLQLIMHDCCPKVMLIDASTGVNGNILLLKSPETIVLNISTLDSVPTSPCPLKEVLGEDPMMITYTSGTTGVPKGIIIRHESVRNFVEFAPPRWGFEEAKETVLQQSSYAFDMAFCQIMVCLGYAGTLVILDETRRRDPDAVCDSIVTHAVTFTLATPSEYLSWIQHSRNRLSQSKEWKGAMSGGEPISETLCREFRSLGKPMLRLINCYGPAEITFGCADFEVSYTQTEVGVASRSTAMKPLPNYTIHILDDFGHVLPNGVSGRIAIGGAGVMKGYLNQDMLTTTSLIPSRHSSTFQDSNGWSKVYLSEDRGRLDADGVVLEGRIKGSTQIKIGGIRVELEEIEYSIIRSMSPHISQVAVSHRKSKDVPATEFLVAFITLSDTEPPADPVSFLERLPEQLPLPQYMRPSLVVPIESLPMTISGKIDRTTIDTLPLTIDSSPGTAPAQTLHDKESSMEKVVLALWRDVLPTEVASSIDIAKHTDFFTAGGSSLALISLQRRMKERLSIHMPLQTLFQYSTLGQMASALEKGQESQDTGHPSTNETAIDLYTEAEIPNWIVSIGALHPSSLVPVSSHETVVMTGATGFLGREILKQLVADVTVQRIHCIAIRRSIDGLSELFLHPKISLHAGDLKASRLGLSQSTVDTVFAQADVVIHTAADVSFLKSYQSLKQSNVASIWALVAFCLPRRVPLHFVSSASVSRLSGNEMAESTSAGKLPPPNAVEDGYTATKWVAEVFLERVSRETKLPVVIHRPSSIIGENSPALDLVGNLVKYTKKISALPLLDTWSGYLDLISVETAAREIIQHIETSVQRGQPGDDHFRCVHEVGEVEIRLQDLQYVLERDWGRELKLLPATKWIDRAVEAGMDESLAVYLRQALSRPMLLPQLVKGNVALEERRK